MIASRENTAYAAYAQNGAPVPVQQERTLHSVAAPRRRRKAHLRPSVVLCGLLLIAAAAYILFCHMQLTQLTAEVSKQSQKLDELTAASVSLSTKQRYSMDLTEVEEYAVNNLGMVKMDSSQIEYVELTNPDSVTVTESSVALDTLFAGLVRSFSAVLEYIR